MIDKTITLHIRVPEGLVKQIKVAAKESGNPMGTALKYLIEQATNENIETRLTGIEERIEEIIKKLDSWDKILQHKHILPFKTTINEPIT